MHPMWVLVLAQQLRFPSKSLLVARERAEEAQTLGTMHLHARPKRVSGSWLHIGAAKAVVFTWVVKHWVEDFPLSLLLSVYLTL